MKNHFIFGYFGNKRNEVEKIYDNINLDKITTIIEPFCGSQAFSYYIYTKHPNKFKYVLNDNDHRLIELMNLLKDVDKTKEFENNINKILFPNEDEIPLTKEQYMNIEEPLYKYFIHHKYKSIRPSLYPTKSIDSIKKINLSDHPFIKFIRNEDVIYTCRDGLDIYDEYKNKKDCLMFIDPPYLMSENGWYKNAKLNIYEYLSKNEIKKEKSKIYLCLEANWIIKLLFKNHNTIYYEKKYNNNKHRQTEHILISNK